LDDAESFDPLAETNSGKIHLGALLLPRKQVGGEESLEESGADDSSEEGDGIGRDYALITSDWREMNADGVVTCPLLSFREF
jgi:hypothetical protein